MAWYGLSCTDIGLVNYSKLFFVRRNLNSGNIFVELLNSEPHLLVTDFGRVSADEVDDGSSHCEQVSCRQLGKLVGMFVLQWFKCWLGDG